MYAFRPYHQFFFLKKLQIVVEHAIILFQASTCFVQFRFIFHKLILSGNAGS